ncbi:MAG TPA: hypothetical protein VNQ56_06245 [Pseudolabrys sp.]|nr:hypothetical protein [Pseudolabrys sp.]
MSAPDIGNIAQAAHHLAIAADMLQELVCQLGAGDGKLDAEKFGRAFYVALKTKQDAAALRELVETVQQS